MCQELTNGGASGEFMSPEGVVIESRKAHIQLTVGL